MRLQPDDNGKFEDVAGLPATSFVFEITRDLIESGDHRVFLRYFDVERIARAGLIHRLWGTLCIMISGYDDDPRELHEVPEVRSYFQSLAKQWPYFFFACSLADDFLQQLFWCLLPEVTTLISKKDPNRFLSRIPTADANRIYRELLTPFQQLSGKNLEVRKDETLFHRRVDAIQKYFQAMTK